MLRALVKNRKLEKPQLTLTVDLCAKILRTKSLLDAIHNGKNPNNNLSPSQQNQARRAEYFEKKKGMKLKYPNAKPLVAVLGRNKSTIYLPAELVCGNEIEARIN